MKKLLAFVVCTVLCLLLFAACGNNSETQALKDRIAELEKQLENSSYHEIAALQKQLDDLKKTQAADKTALDQKISALEARLLVLEGLTETDPNKVYDMGEPFTFYNNGKKLFEVKLKEYHLSGYDMTDYVLSVDITNFSMPTNVIANNYFACFAYNANTNQYYYTGWGSSALDTGLNIKQTIEALFNFFNGIPPVPITHFVIGIPTQDSSIATIIPFATYRLPHPIPAA